MNNNNTNSNVLRGDTKIIAVHFSFPVSQQTSKYETRCREAKSQ